MLAALTPFLLFVAFLLLLLVSLSVPIIKSIYLFRLAANVSASLFRAGASTSVTFGVWGYCSSGVDVVVVGINHDSAGECSKAHLGYTFNKTVGDALHISGFENLISRTLTAALVLHPVACGLTFLAFVISLAMLRRGTTGSRIASTLTLATAGLAALITTIIFLIDVILVAVVRKRVNDHSNGDVTLNWGNAVWMTLGATVALWGSLAGACCGICACGRRDRKTEHY